MTSLTCDTPSRAATRGARSLPKVVDGANICVYPAAAFAIWGARTAASAWAFSVRVTVNTLRTPSIFAASVATASGASESTMMSTASGCAAVAALTARAVAPFSLPSRCSAITRILLISILRAAALKQALLLEGRDELGGVLDHHALCPLGRRGVMRGLDVISDIDAKRAKIDHV